MKLDNIEIGNRIRNIRTNRKMTQESLAEKADLSLTHICNLENGRAKMSIDSLVNIADILEVSTDELLYGHISYGQERFYTEYVDLLLDCDDLEKAIILETSHSLKRALKKNR